MATGIPDRPCQLSVETHTQLVTQSVAAKHNSYSPYSKFRVGAALLTECGQVFTGCNVENSSYGLTMCAERTAIVKAVSEGYKKFKAIAIATDLQEACAPCGACRQFLAEWGFDWEVILTRGDGTSANLSVRDLLPYGFDPSHLSLPRTNTQ